VETLSEQQCWQDQGATKCLAA